MRSVIVLGAAAILYAGCAATHIRVDAAVDGEVVMVLRGVPCGRGICGSLSESPSEVCLYCRPRGTSESGSPQCGEMPASAPDFWRFEHLCPGSQQLTSDEGLLALRVHCDGPEDCIEPAPVCFRYDFRYEWFSVCLSREFAARARGNVICHDDSHCSGRRCAPSDHPALHECR